MEKQENFIQEEIILEENIPQKTMRDRIKGMNVGDVLNFPIEKYKSIKTTCSDIKLFSGMCYTTKLVKAENTITVKRIS